MKIFTALALTLSVFAVTSSAAPVASPEGSLIETLTGAIPFGSLNSLSPSAQPSREDVSSKASPSRDAVFAKRSENEDHVEKVLGAIVSVNTKIIAKALLKLKLDLCADIHARVKVFTTGLLPMNNDLVLPKISERVQDETHQAINTKVESDAQTMILDKIREHGRELIEKYCPHFDDGCMSRHAEHIVKGVEALVKVDVEHLFIALKASLMKHVRARLAIVVEELSVNLPLEQIHVQVNVEAVAELTLHLDTCSHIIVKGLHATVLAQAAANIRAICATVVV